jgi:phage shock protein A
MQSVEDSNSRRARQYQQLHTQLERLQRNINKLKTSTEITAEQVGTIRRLGIIHTSM